MVFLLEKDDEEDDLLIFLDDRLWNKNNSQIFG